MSGSNRTQKDQIVFGEILIPSVRQCKFLKNKKISEMI